MLRQLLSGNGEEIGSLSKPIGIEFKSDTHDYAIPQQTGNYYYPSTEYTNYQQPPQQTTVIQSPFTYQQQIHGQYEVMPSSTADLYSSTYAMLSTDGIPLQNEWGYTTIEKHDPYQQYPPQQVVQYTTIPLVPQSGQYIQEPIVQYPQTQYYPNYIEQTSQQPSTSAENCSRPGTAELKNRRSSVTARSAQQAYSESFRKIAKIPGNPLDEEEERVMCLACKGVYSSRRSLTGHIGRNEKCREIIGRTYIHTLAQTGQSEILPDPGSVDGGISPVCPNCDRFISHYKGNIRRHINQCMKRPVRDHKSSNLPSSVKSVAQHYASIAPVVTKDDPAYHQLATTEIEQPMSETIFYPADPQPGKKIKSSNSSNVAVQSSNPYTCSWCKFSTVYKGNMKRHLISVHNCTDELLRSIAFDLERLRALSTDRPIAPLCPQPERIRGCSGRRRKCRPKNEKTDEIKKMKLLGENEIPPTAVSDVVASFASPIPTKFAEEHAAASHDSGISSGSSIDEL